jgi:ABC-type dipeptide/oligopeptide/nickel transport system permease subunit
MTEPNTQEQRKKGLSQYGLAWQRFKRNKVALVGMVMVGTILFLAIFAPLISPYDPDRRWFVEGLARTPPSSDHPFGVDKLGRDVLANVIYGARTALFVGLVSTAITLLIAVPLGAISGYIGGRFDELAMRFADAFIIFPSYLLILLSIKVFSALVMGFSISYIAVIIGFFGWPGMARLVRGQVRMLKNSDFVEGAKCLGANRMRIIFRHLLPGVIPLIMTTSMTAIAGRIMMLVSITFLGFGDPTVQDWGAMINLGRDALTTSYWESTFPAIFLFYSTLGFNLLADGMSDALNPRLVR